MTDQPATIATPTSARMIIGGEPVDAADGQTFEVTNPATGLVIATAPPVSAAISSARCTTCGMGSNPGGVATRTVMPASTIRRAAASGSASVTSGFG